MKIQLVAFAVASVSALIALLVIGAPFSLTAGWSDGPSPSASMVTKRVGDRSEEAALHTAIRYLESIEDAPAMGPHAAAGAQRAMSTAASGEELAADVEEGLSQLMELYPRVRIRVAPIESRTTARGDGWEVAIWYTGTITLDEMVIEEWRTVTYQLVWERERWLIDSIESVVGPVPMSPLLVESTPGAEFEAALSGFVDNVGRDR